MAIGKQMTAGGPVCPNHRCVLLSIGQTPQKGQKVKMQCPISSALFDVEADAEEKEEVQDKFGRKMTAYTVSGGGAQG